MNKNISTLINAKIEISQNKFGTIVEIFVNWNDTWMSLIDCMRFLEKPHIQPDSIPGNYKWCRANDFYEDHVIHKSMKKIHTILASRVDRQKPFYYHPFSIITTEVGEIIMWTPCVGNTLPKLFKTFPEYPVFAFHKTQFYEKMEILRPLYEKALQEEKEWQSVQQKLHQQNRDWDKTTFTNTFDVSTIGTLIDNSPIFEIIYSETLKNEVVKINVEWEKERLPLLDVLHIWESRFERHKEKPGNYDWLTIPQFYRELFSGPWNYAPFRQTLCCTCRNEGCWPFLVEVLESEKYVIWTNFRQPHRNKYSLGGFWDYSTNPPFFFDKQQYYDELGRFRSQCEL